MTIGPDIAEVLQEVGIAITIEDVDGNQTTGEYSYTEPNSQVTKPFIKEFFLEGWLSYITAANVGDYIIFGVTGDRYIVMNKTPQIFENAVIKYDIILYKTNVVVDVLRPTTDESNRDAQTYQLVTTWSTIKADVNVLLTTPLYGHDLSEDEELGQLGLEVHEMYIPKDVGIQPLDRIRVTSTEYYMVSTVKPRRYSDVDVVELTEDTRPAASTTTTTTTTSSSSTTTTSSSSTTTTTV